MLIAELSKIIKERRKTLAITQAHLAELAGVNPNTIIRIEKGLINPGIKLIDNIVDVMGMELTLVVKKQADH